MAKLSPKIKFFDEEKMKLVNPETIRLYNKYKIDMTLRELSPKSIEGYYNDLSHLWLYTVEHLGNVPITDLNEDDLTEFFYYCKVNGNNSRRIKRRMSSISAFYKYLCKKKIIKVNPMEFIDRPSKDTDIIVQTFLTMEQVEAIKEKLKEAFKTAETDIARHQAMSYLTYAMFSLSTMARVTAVSNTRWEQINFEERLVEDVLEKEGKVVTLYFSEEVRTLLYTLQEIRENYGIDDKGYVFVTKVAGAYKRGTTSTLNQWTKKIGEMIGVSTLHPHDWRHSGSQLMRLAGAEIQDISALLNHSGTDVTVKHYLRVDKAKVQKNRDKFGI